MSTKSADSRKQLIVVAGPNGAGKTTFALKYAAESGLPYLGADAIAYELAPDDPTSARVAAGREFLRRVAEGLLGEGSLVVESTLAGRSFVRLVHDANTAGFSITIIYLFLKSIDHCIDRVVARVKSGGHDVPEVDIRRRFARSLSNFWHLYRPFADEWIVVYNSGDKPVDVAQGRGDEVTVRDAELFEQFQTLLRTR